VQTCVRFTSSDVLLALLSIHTLTKIGVPVSLYIFVSFVFLYVPQMGLVSLSLRVIFIRNIVYGNTVLAVGMFCTIIDSVA
jgi:hypothetical protein